MKKDINHLLEKASKLRNEQPLVPMEQLRSAVERRSNSIDKKITFSNFKRNITMSAILIGLLTTAWLLFWPAEKEQTAGDAPVKYKSEFKGEAPDVAVNNDLLQLTANNKKTEQDNNDDGQSYTFKMNYNTNKWLPVSIEGIPFIELENENDLNKLGIIKNDTAISFITERFYYDLSKSRAMQLAELKYDTSCKNPIVVRSMNIITNNFKNKSYDLPYDLNRVFSKLAPVCYKYTNYGGIPEHSPIFRYSNDTILTQLHKIQMEKMHYFYKGEKEKDKSKLAEYFDKESELSEMEYIYGNEVMIRKMIPVKIKITGSEYLYLWFVPNEELIAALPEKYAGRVREKMVEDDLTENTVQNIAGISELNLTYEEAEKFGIKITEKEFVLTYEQSFNINNWEGELYEKVKKSFESDNYKIDTAMLVKSKLIIDLDHYDKNEHKRIKYTGWNYEDWSMFAPIAINWNYKVNKLLDTSKNILLHYVLLILICHP